MEFILKALAANEDVVQSGDLDLQLLGSATDLPTLVGKVLPWVGAAAGILAFAYLIFSGFLYLTAGGNAESAKKGQQGILNAIIGLVIIALAYTITTALIGTFNSTTTP